jgi:hypothetical protein
VAIVRLVRVKISGFNIESGNWVQILKPIGRRIAAPIVVATILG